MTPAEKLLLTLGLLLIAGLAADYLGRKTPLPRVTLLLILGMVAGPEGLALIPDFVIAQFDLIANLALVMIGFLLGERFTPRRLRAHAGEIFALSIGAALGAAVVITLGLWATGVALPLALVLGAIAAATDPAATTDVVHQEAARGPFSKLLLAVVALDDAWGLIIFSLSVTAAAALYRSGMDGSLLADAAGDIFGAAGIGLALGIPAAYLTGRIRSGEPILTEALALVFLCGGLSIFLDVSFLIAAMVMGATVANLARHHDRPFHAIASVDWPLMILFFVLAGASLEFDAVMLLGATGLSYVLWRIIGKVVGGWAGARLGHSDRATGRWIGVALLPQAGVAMGMALVAANALPEYRQTILSVAIASTVLFELVGPVATRLALKRTAPEP